MIFILFLLIAITLIIWIFQLFQLIKDEAHYSTLLKMNTKKNPT